jgi:dTDP-glucose 4,6-dehydratase
MPLAHLADVEGDDRYVFVKGDIADADLVRSLLADGDSIVHFAAESHVDRSILDSGPFVATNVLGTQRLLDAARSREGVRFVHVSTDEVYGSLSLDDPTSRFTEWTPIAPNSPYAASKAGSDLLVRAAHHTFGLDAVITRCSNNFGPYQFPEKVIPLFVTNVLEGKRVPLYGDGLNVRDWVHVDDHAEAVLRVWERGVAGEAYNIGGENERSNLELTRMLLGLMGKDDAWIEPVKDRAGHDRRYAMDITRIRDELGWNPTRSAWPDALERTIRWYVDHPDWWKRVRSGAYRDYYEKQYVRR